MAEEKKESSGGDGIKEEKEQHKIQDDQNHNNDIIIAVIKVDMHCHCQACAKKIAKALRASQGVEDVAVDRKTSMVVVKGKMTEPMNLCDRIRHKTGRNAHLLSPLPKPPEDDQSKDDDNKSKDQQQQQPQQKVDQEAGAVTVVLGVHMHCEACAQLLRKRIRKMKGVESVETDIGKGEVKVKGEIGDPQILVEYVHKKTRKHVSLLVNKDDIAQGEEQQNQDKDKDKKEEEDNNVDDNNTNNIIQQQQEDANTRMMMMMMAEMNSSRYGHNSYYNNNNYNMDHHHHRLNNNYDHHIISNNNNNNYEPQFFSDENPNACSLM